MRHIPSILILVALLAARSPAQPDTVNFESPATHPVRLSPDGTRAFVVQTADGRLSVFDLANPDLPVLVAEIPVGLEPVSVHPRTDDEVWVVNHVSDSVSVVSVAAGVVLQTISVGDEPADVVFAGEPMRAFVSVAGRHEVVAIDPATRDIVATVPLDGEHPRALAVRPDGKAVYVAFALSGNRTTTIPPAIAPAPPPPTNPNLPAPPKVALIVDAEDPIWSAAIPYDVLDHDVAEIDAQTFQVIRTFARVGTVNFGIAVQPTTGDLYVANTDHRNLERFLPNLRGRAVVNRVTRVTVGPTPSITPFDLNPTIDDSILPNPAAQAIALAQPTDLAFDPGGQHFYVAAFGSDRIARLDAGGNVLARIELRPPGIDSTGARGPRGLALHSAAHRLYVANRIANSLIVIDTRTDQVVGEVPIGSFDPTPAAVAAGRGFLYDARLSGNGLTSCASCHVDGDDDRLAWDLGDPGGSMVDVTDPQTGTVWAMHPMKGPMVNRTMKGLAGLDPFNWRGDRPHFPAFNEGFASLLGGSTLDPVSFAKFQAFFESLTLAPNPNRLPDGSFLPLLNGGDPLAGSSIYASSSCLTCHALENQTKIFVTKENPNGLPFKVPDFRSFYRKAEFNVGFGAKNRIGFGSFHDGTKGSTSATGTFAPTTAFFASFDTGTPPVVGFARTIDAANAAGAALLADVAMLEAQAGLGNCDVTGRGRVDGVPRGLFFDVGLGAYLSDETGVGPFTFAELAQKALAGNATFTLLATPRGTGRRIGIDRDRDGVLDGDEAGPGFFPFGNGCAGTGGTVPALEGLGVPAPDQNVALVLSLARPSAPGLLLLGLGSTQLPLDPFCDLEIAPLVPSFHLSFVTTGSGGLALAGALPDTTPIGIDVYFQVLIQDGAASAGIATSRPLRMRLE